MAEFERALIKERQREGIAAAKKAGKRLGWKPALSDAQVRVILTRKNAGEKVSALARDYVVYREAVYKALKRF